MNEKLNILMIGAHPDDCDFRCGGIATKYVNIGHSVTFLSVSNGCCGHHLMSPDRVKEVRAKETQAVAKLTGINYDVWDVNDCEVTADLATRKKLIRYIRKLKPNIIFTHRNNDYHTDHRNTALLVQDASYLLSVPNFCPEVPAIDLPVIMYFYDKFTNPIFTPDIVVPIDDVIENKYAMFECHVSQVYEFLPFLDGVLDQVPSDRVKRLEWLHEPRVPRDGTILTEADINVYAPSNNSEYREAAPAVKYRDKIRSRYGDTADSVLFAEAFQCSEYGAPLTDKNIKLLFPF